MLQLVRVKISTVTFQETIDSDHKMPHMLYMAIYLCFLWSICKMKYFYSIFSPNSPSYQFNRMASAEDLG